MIRIGVTGSIGMGKSTIARQLREMGLPLFCSDKAVHCLLEKGGEAVSAVAEVFPATLQCEAIDRKKLGAAVFDDEVAMERLENILHPLVRQEQERFARRHARDWATVFDIPLLFETGGERRMDVVLVASAPYHIQQQRVLARPGMTKERFKAILSRQMPDSEKRRRADRVIHTGGGLAHSRRQLKECLAWLRRHHMQEEHHHA